MRRIDPMTYSGYADGTPNVMARVSQWWESRFVVSLHTDVPVAAGTGKEAALAGDLAFVRVTIGVETEDLEHVYDLLAQLTRDPAIRTFRVERPELDETRFSRLAEPDECSQFYVPALRVSGRR
jgi:hypothetical protein